MELLVLVELPSLICHLGEVSGQSAVASAGRERSSPAERRWLSWGVMWVRKKCFMSRIHTESGRRQCVGPAQSCWEVWEQCASSEAGQIPGEGLCRGLPPAGASEGWESVCAYILCCLWIGGGPNDSWPHCVSFWPSLIWGLRAIRGPEHSRWDKKSSPR